jgi:hypothetical protein
MFQSSYFSRFYMPPSYFPRLEVDLPNIQEWRDSNGTLVSSITSTGVGAFQAIATAPGFPSSFGGPALSNVAMTLNTSQSTSTGLVVQGTAGQTGDLTRWQDSQGNTLAVIDRTGKGTFSGLSGGFVPTAPSIASSTTGIWMPRTADLLDSVIYDYQDEAAFIDRRQATIASVPAPGTGSLINLLRDNSDIAVWNSGTSPWPIVLTLDCSSNPIQPKNSGSYAIGLTFRSSGTAASLPTNIRIEFWDEVALTYVAVADLPFSGLTSFGGWISPRLLATPPAFRVSKVRLTLSGNNPLGVADTFRLQRMMIYHATATWDPWHLHVGGGTLFGSLTIDSGVASTKGLVVKAATAQTANLLEWQGPTGDTRLAIAANGRDLILDPSLGTTIGTSPTQKLGFFGASPVVKPSALTPVDNTTTPNTASAPTNSLIANLRTRLNDLENRLRSLGLLT